MDPTVRQAEIAVDHIKTITRQKEQYKRLLGIFEFSLAISDNKRLVQVARDAVKHPGLGADVYKIIRGAMERKDIPLIGEAGEAYDEIKRLADRDSCSEGGA